ncbi:BCCT family transporter [Peribacillus sp. NPDC097675]|uniref:BCCT family transporter n=1 Tax=Peribacillus sp. NPDC097675 TaxID=3390618 RepID=UPI003CFD9F76
MQLRKEVTMRLKLNSVFWISAIIVTLVVIIGAVIPKTFANVANAALDFTTSSFGWLFLAAVFLFVVFLIYLVFSKYGKIRLGGEDERPEFPLFSWIGMLFSCGFGIALVFYGIGEPMSHFFTPPYKDVEPLTTESARLAMGYSFFHYGVSQWAIFSIVGLAMAYFQFRKKENGLVSTTLSPIIGKGRHEKPTKKFIDILAITATIMGVATSLGLGIMQIDGGIRFSYNMPDASWIKIVIVIVMMALFLTSAITGINKGMKWLSTFNLFAVFLIMLFIFITGPTQFILDTFIVGISDYISNFVTYSLRLNPYNGNPWVYKWTIFYWAWAIAWSPFVGSFIARVSRGRTIREFIIGVMVAPPVIALVWIAIFGGTALHMDLFEGTEIAAAVNDDITSALFTMLQGLPISGVVTVFVLILILTFLVTSVDSAVFILSSMSTNGSLNPPIFVRVIWGVLMGAIALVLLLSSGLTGLQSASVVSALPFTIILLLIMVAFYKTMRKDLKLAPKPASAKKRSVIRRKR